ncbi:MAG: HD domain-containing protein, partial [Nanoarchaeota archaeon]|nr:HD domain-containing protein [Nanoarchaeota archaeon]
MKAASPLSLEELVKDLPDNYTNADRELVQRAYRLAERVHNGQKRASGEPYINHCLAVAAILAGLHMPADVVAAGLLHDTVEDTSVTLVDLRRDFGESIAKLVDGVTKLTQLPRVSRGEHQEELKNKVSHSGISEQAEDEQSRRNRKRTLAIETLRKTFLAM